MTYAPSAPEEIWKLTGLSDGAKMTVVRLWGKADHDAQRECRPTTVWVPGIVDPETGKDLPPTECLIRWLQENVHPGKSDRTIRGHLTEARKAGLANAKGRCVDLYPPGWRKSASERPKSAGENLPALGQNPPQPGENLPVDGEIPPPQLNPFSPHQIPTIPPEQRARARDPDPDTPPPASRAPPDEPTLFALAQPEAKLDYVREVFDHLVARVIAAKRDLGVTPASAPSRTLTPARRKRIMARIRESGAGDLALGVEMCKRVIAVDEAECRAQGPGGKSWDYWTADTPFRNAENFESRLNRWRADGNHRPFGGGRPDASRHDANTGTASRHGTSDHKHRLARMAAANDG